MNEDLISTINSAIKEESTHLQRLHDSDFYLQGVRPFTVETLESIDKEAVLHLDQFIYRFMKLQDSIARRLLPSLYALLESDTEPKPFLDVLRRLEQLNVITSVETWQRFRNLRNNLAHDYPESLQQTADTLNELLETWREMELIFTSARDAFYRHS